MNHTYFPMFVDISGKKILVVGGGSVAARRIKTLLLFTNEVTVVSPKLCGELMPLPEGVKWIAREYGAKGMTEKGAASVGPDAVQGGVDTALFGMDIVLAATNKSGVNQKVYADCQLLQKRENRRILVNCADDKSRCDFFFPAVVQKEEITIGINSGGRNMKKVREVRQKMERI